jgi:hypothetical protein
VTAQLADDLARVLHGEPLGLCFHELARRVGRRDSLVRAALRDDRRFARIGTGRGARWRVRNRREKPRADLGREAEEQARVRAMLDLRGPWWGL